MLCALGYVLNHLSLRKPFLPSPFTLGQRRAGLLSSLSFLDASSPLEQRDLRRVASPKEPSSFFHLGKLNGKNISLRISFLLHGIVENTRAPHDKNAFYSSNCFHNKRFLKIFFYMFVNGARSRFFTTYHCPLSFSLGPQIRFLELIGGGCQPLRPWPRRELANKEA